MATSPSLSFESTTLDVIDRDGEPWLRGPQIGDALGYSKEGRVAIDKLYKANADEFTDTMTALVKLPTAGGEQTVRIFSLRGAHLLGMFARTDKAAAFRRWVLDVLDKQAVPEPPSPPELPAINPEALLAPDRKLPEPDLTPHQQRLVAAHAATLSNEAFRLVHSHLLYVLATRAALSDGGAVPDYKVHETIARTTLGSALARSHYENLRWISSMADMAHNLVQGYRAELRRELSPVLDMCAAPSAPAALNAPEVGLEGKRELTAANPQQEALVKKWERWCNTRARVVNTPDTEVDGVSFQCMLDAYHLADPEDLGRKVFEIQHVRRDPHFAQVAMKELNISRQHAYRLLYRFRAELINGAKRLTELRKNPLAT